MSEGEGSVVVLCLLCCATFFCIGGCTGKDYTRESAVEAGVAEWQIDPKTGVTSFVWRKCQ